MNARVEVFSRPCGTEYRFVRITQDYVLGYFQTSLWDFAAVEYLMWHRGRGSI
jgi:hypothetical protein